MAVSLRVVLDQVGHIADPDQAEASLELAAGLVATAPNGCVVDAIVPSGGSPEIPGLGDVRVVGRGRRELLASWQIGLAPGIGGGLIHAPTLLAPFVRHDRIDEGDQIVGTLWDLRAWEAPETLHKSQVAWQRGMLRRAFKHADAIVVPSHGIAERLEDFARFGDRSRVIAGAAPAGFSAPPDAAERRERLQLPERYLVITGFAGSCEPAFRAAAAAGIDAVVLDAEEGTEPRLAALAASAGLAEQRAHVRGRLGTEDRAAVLSGAAVFVATSALSAWPWRAVEALSLRVPVVAVDSGVHRDIIAEGGSVVAAEEVPDAVGEALSAAAERWKVLAGDRSRAFSWASTAERVWSLHADL